MANTFGTTVGASITLLAVLAFTGAAQAQTFANGPYYATPSWDQKAPAATRFIVLSNFNNEAVLDRETGLVWERSPSAFDMDWYLARRACVEKAVGGRRGWRLPSIHELGSLIDPTESLPALPAGHPFLNISDLAIYWSATLNALSSNAYWSVDIYHGESFNGSFSSKQKRYFWCVRGGQNHGDAY